MYQRGLNNLLPTTLIGTVRRLVSPQNWGDVYVACSGAFRVERGLAAAHPELRLHGNDLALFPTAMARAALGEPLDFRFVGEMAFLEDAADLSDPLTRLAALQVAQNIIGILTWPEGRNRDTHLAHAKLRAPVYVNKGRDALVKVVKSLRLASFSAQDFRDVVDEAVDGGHGVIVIPPTSFEPDRPALKILDNVDWRPTGRARAYDPTEDLPKLLRRLRDSGAPFFLGAEVEIAGERPQARIEAKGALPLLGYHHEARTAFRGITRTSQPFAYQAVDLARLHKKSRLTVVPVPEANINFLREAYLKKGIAFAQGEYGALVYLDGMLAGCVSYKRIQGDRKSLYLLTDLSVTREGRIAKLIARAATHHDLFRPFERKHILRFDAVRTAAFSAHPEAMKYRGTWEVESREELTDGADRFKIRYVSKPREEPLQEAFRWWWSRGGEGEVAAARKRGQAGRPQAAPAA